MKRQLTAKLKLRPTPEQREALKEATLAYRDALNHASKVAFENGKISNQMQLQKLVYQEIRWCFGLTSQMACNVPRQVGAVYKTLWSKAKWNAAHRKQGITKRRYRGLDQPPKFVSRTLTLSYGRDYSFKKDQKASIGTLSGRIIIPYEGYEKHLDLIREDAKIGAARLHYDRAKKAYYLLVSLEVEHPNSKPEHQNVAGVDVGMRYLAVATDTKNKTLFVSGKEARHRADSYERIRRTLQRKGTRSARLRLKAMAGRERRFKRDMNHRVAKRIAKAFPRSIVGLEELDGIRERTERCSSKHASEGQRRFNLRYSRWAYAELQTLIAHKLPEVGSMAVKVDAKYTSRACPRCGHVTRENRPGEGLSFRCVACDLKLHADLVGARNVAMRTLLVWQDWMSTGLLSAAPDASDEKTKAARLKRYTELRWSPEASPVP